VLAPVGKSGRHLSSAVIQDDVQALEGLQAAGMDLQKPCTRGGFNPLQLASREGSIEVVKWLLRQGTDVNVGEGSELGTPLQLAAAGGHCKVVELLLRSYAYVHAKDAHGSTALHAACTCCQNSEGVRRLLDFGADPNSTNNRGQTPLLLLLQAVSSGTSSSKGSISRILALMLAAKADPTIEDAQGQSPFEVAFRSSTRATSSQPSNQPPADDEMDATATSSSGSSSSLNTLGIAQQLVASHLGPGAEPMAKLRVCLRAFQAGAKAVAQQILAMGGLESVINQGDDLGATLLHFAAARNWGDMVQQVLQLGAAPDPSMHQGRTTPLFYAVAHRCEGVVQPLLAGGANPFHFDAEGLTVLHRAAIAGCAGMVQLMLAAAQQQGRGAMVDMLARQDVGSREEWVLDTALHRAAVRGHPAVVRVLLQGGADPAAKDSNGETALEALCRAWPGSDNEIQASLTQVIAVFAQAGLLDAMNGGQTALHRAVQQWRKELATVLVEAGASCSLVNGQGRTALEGAAQSSFQGRDAGWLQTVLAMVRQELRAYAKQQQGVQQQPQKPLPQPPQPQQQQAAVAGPQATSSRQQSIVRVLYMMRDALPQCLAAVVEILGAGGAPGLWADLLAHHAALPEDQQAPGVTLVTAMAQGCLLWRTPQLQQRAAVLKRLQQLVLEPGMHNTQLAEERADVQAAAVAEYQQQAQLGGGFGRCLRMVEEVWCASESQAVCVLNSIALASAGQREGPQVGAQATTFCRAVLAAWAKGGTSPPLQKELAEAVAGAIEVCRQGKFARARG
jgi:ankyrin repeat protein/uncharacterized protein YjeT (DUF2065 family)